MNNEQKRNLSVITFSNFFWRYAERVLAQLISFIVSVVLARILLPEDYGSIALVSVFISIFQVFVDSGLGSALVQKKDADDLDFSTVFYFNIFWCAFLYLLIYFLSPEIAKFYKDISLIPIIKVLGLTIVISGVKNIQQAYVSRTLQFKKFFWSTLGGTLCSAIVGISMALKDFGIWALVAQNLSNLFIDTLVLWITVKWRPKKIFSFRRLKALFAYGWKLLASSLLDTGYSNLRQLVIGKVYTSKDLAYYNRGEQIPHLVVTNIITSISSVLLPVMSNAQDNIEEVKKMTQRAIRISSYVMSPLMFGLAVIAKPLISLILTDKWIESALYLRICCFDFMLYPIHSANLTAIKSIGRSDIFLKLEIEKKIVGIVLLLITMRISVEAMAYSLLVSGIISLAINVYPNTKLFHYTIIEQLKDIMPGIIFSFIMSIIIYPIQFAHTSSLITIILQICIGGFIYIMLSKITNNDAYSSICSIIRPYLYRLKTNFKK